MKKTTKQFSVAPLAEVLKKARPIVDEKLPDGIANARRAPAVSASKEPRLTPIARSKK